MANITIQQAYAIANGVWVNPYSGGRRDQDELPFGNYPTGSFVELTGFKSVFGTTKNRLTRLLDGTLIDLPAIPGPVGVTVNPVNQNYTLVSTSAALASSTSGGFDSPIFEPQEFIGTVRQNYNYRTGADFIPNNSILAAEQLYHLAGLGIINKLKK